MSAESVLSVPAVPRMLVTRSIVQQAVMDSFIKLLPHHQWRNPVMFVVYVGSILTTYLYSQALAGHGEDGLHALLRTLDAGVKKGKRTQVTLSADDVNLWLGVLNDARLAFGTRLDITDDTNIWYSPPDDSMAAERAAYAWLTTLQSLLVDTMLETLPD